MKLVECKVEQTPSFVIAQFSLYHRDKHMNVNIIIYALSLIMNIMQIPKTVREFQRNVFGACFVLGFFLVSSFSLTGDHLSIYLKNLCQYFVPFGFLEVI